MDSFPLSDLNWAQKYIRRIKNTGGTLHTTCTIHIQQLWRCSERRLSVSSKRLSFCLLQNQMDLYKHKMTVDSVGIHNDKYDSQFLA